jgi:outer membrane protein insertion porin family
MSGRIRILFILLFLLSLSWTFALSETNHIQEDEEVLEKILVVINGVRNTGAMGELVPLSEGEVFSLKKIRDAVKSIYGTGLFADIQVEMERLPGIQLTFLLTKKLFVRRIEFEGIEDISRRKLGEALFALQDGSPFSDERLSKAKYELAQILEEQGFFQAEVMASTEFDVLNSQVDVVFDVQQTKTFTVKEISFSGDIIIDESELRRKMQTEPGEIFVPSILEEDISRIRNIFLSMDYQRVEINTEKRFFEDDGQLVSLILSIVPHEKIEIIVEGAKIPIDLLKPIWEAGIFEEWGMDEGEAKIIQYLREKNYLFPNVVSSVEREKNNLRVMYRVTPGERYKIKQILIQGASHFSSEQIREELGIPEKFPLLSNITGDRLYELPRDIEFLYRTEGFSEAEVILNFLNKEMKIQPVIFIQEGAQEKISSLTVEGNLLFSEEELLGELSSEVEGPFFQPNIQRDVEKLESFYLNQGVRGTSVRAFVQEEEKGKHDVRFQIDEGGEIKIENIIISGNETTQKKVILRELEVQEGDYVHYDLLQRTKRQLENLGIFAQVKIEEIPFSQESVNLLISLVEGQRNYGSLGLGFETKNTPHSFAFWDYVIRPRGTAEFIRSNIFGSAAQLSLVGQFSLREQRAVVSWDQPYFFGLPLQTFVNAWLEREERESYSFDRRGFSLSTIGTLSDKEDMILLGTLRFARTTLYELYISESEIDRQHFPFSTTSISGSFIWDKRDDPFNPERGLFFSSVLEWAYPLFNSESDYQRSFSKYQHHIPVWPRVTFIMTTRLGLGRGRMPIHERFFAGGSNSFRGVEFDGLGPKDSVSLKSIGGKALVLFNFELVFPLVSKVENLFGTVFYDSGNVFERRIQVSLEAFQNAVGFGLRYRTPLGPLRFELGWNLNAPAGERKPLAFITIGNVF